MSTVLYLDPIILAELAARVANAQASTDNFAWQDSYEYLLEQISDLDSNGSPIGPKDGVPVTEWLWINGAKAVNASEGPLAQFIREYTNEQYLIRTGTMLDSGAIQGDYE